MNETTNVDRAKWALAAVQTFANVTGVETSTAGDIQCAIIDLLADLMHLGDVNGFQLSELVESAQRHYNAERWEK